MNEIIESLALEPSWKERIMAKISAFSEQDRILKERKRITDKLHRLCKAYVDGLVEEVEYDLQRKLLQSSLETLVVPEADAAIKAGELIENLGRIWEGATLAEKHKLLTTMLDAVYIDLLTSRRIVGLLPKPPFYQLFETLKRNPDSKVIIFNPQEKENALDSSGHVLGLVETGESQSTSAPNILSVLRKRRALAVVFK